MEPEEESLEGERKTENKGIKLTRVEWKWKWELFTSILN